MNSESIIGRFEAAAVQWGDRKAITFLRGGRIETQLTYSQLSMDIRQFTNYLINLNVTKGDRVILFMEKSVIALVAHFALQRLGAIAVPLNPGFKQNELAYLMTDADAKLVITSSGKIELLKKINAHIPILELSTQRPYGDIDVFRSAPESSLEIQIKPEDPGLIIYTSGTTGNPKGAILTQRNLVHDADNIIKVWEISETDVLCHALPLFHVHGLCFALHTLLLRGGHVRMLDQFMPETVLEELSARTDRSNCTVFMAVPTMYTKIMDHLGENRPDFSHIRLLASGSAPLLVAEFERINQIFGSQPVEREGMSETGMNFSNPLSGDRKPGSIGIPLPGVTVRIVDPETTMDAAPGQIGELWLKSHSITPGYWCKPKETEETFQDGWFKTGDLGRVDKDGYYYLTDRIKHIIITGGENVSAKEVETVINQLDDVSGSCVVGIPDDKWGEKVVAAVVLNPLSNITEAQIKSHCKEKLHDWKCPKQIVFVDEIPKNTMGKMLKEAVKAFFIKK